MGKKKKKARSYPCPLMEAGIYHHHKKQDSWTREGPYMEYCPGLYRINREAVAFEAKLHPDVSCAVGKSPGTHTLHRPVVIYTVWRVYRKEHEYGWGDSFFGSQFELEVKTGCKYPSWLIRPILLRQSDVDEYNDSVFNETVDREQLWKSNGKSEPGLLKYCKRCFPEKAED